MNYLKMKKSIANTQFQDVNQYLTHMDAFNKLSNKKTEEDVQRQRELLNQIAKQSTKKPH